ncbi:lantibiotic dehydratase [Streptomyces sp. x-80]|uniref:lantibiotic dehydratase n=1 Tax=Streptomyces sp. x-80 TaxID=2789282 RepID=UPI003980A48D
MVNELHAIHDELTALGDTGTWGDTRARRVTAGRMRALSGAVDQPLRADLRLGATLVLPHLVADEAAAAADALIRLSPVPTVSASWLDYHRRFTARYGPGTLVPLADVVHSATGLGFPAHFTQSPAPRHVSARDEALLTWAGQAALDGAREIVLDSVLDLPAPEGAAMQRPVSAVSLWADLRAASPEAITRGDFRLGVVGFGRIAAGTGRFLDLLNEEDQRPNSAHGAWLPATEGALLAQLSFPPRHPRSENVLRVPPVLPYVIPLAEHREAADEIIPVTDLALTADTTRLYVVSRSRRRVVEAVVPHARARHTMPPLARLIFEIPRSVHPQVTAFDWGTAACLPYRPRLRYGRSILAPAQWRLNPADLPGPDASTSTWDKVLDQVRERQGLPLWIAVGAGDHQLRLDLDEPMDHALLRSHLKAADRPITLSAAPRADEYGWAGGRAHEIVVPLTATAPPDPAPLALTGPAPLPVADPGDGSGVVYVKLYGPPQTFDTVLTQHLPALLQQWGTAPRWWFARYHHPGPHLRLRLHDADRERAAGRIAAWADGLRQASLVGEIAFDAYRPETGRYGTPVRRWRRPRPCSPPTPPPS